VANKPDEQSVYIFFCACMVLQENDQSACLFEDSVRGALATHHPQINCFEKKERKKRRCITQSFQKMFFLQYSFVISVYGAMDKHVRWRTNTDCICNTADR
jgi:hypothetical protein